MNHRCPYCRQDITDNQAHAEPTPGWWWHWGCHHTLLTDQRWLAQYEPETVLLGEEQ